MPPAPPRRTLDPEEADFFYVPTYLACFFHPIQACPQAACLSSVGLPASAASALSCALGSTMLAGRGSRLPASQF